MNHNSGIETDSDDSLHVVNTSDLGGSEFVTHDIATGEEFSDGEQSAVSQGCEVRLEVQKVLSSSRTVLCNAVQSSFHSIQRSPASTRTLGVGDPFVKPRYRRVAFPGQQERQHIAGHLLEDFWHA